MITTIELSPYIYAQGVLLATLPGGRVAVSVDGREMVGRALGAVSPLKVVPGE